MIQRDVIKKLVSAHRCIYSIRKSSSNINIEKLENESDTLEVVDEEVKIKEQELNKKRNKSRLRDSDRNMLHEKNPYPEPMFWHHGTMKYLRRTYGRYGEASGINPSICWPIKEELNENIEYERVKYPFTIMEMATAARQQRKENEERKLARQAEIIKRIDKLETWKQDLYDRIAKKENEAKAAKDRKERLIEEVRRHFGYTVDPRDEKFKEMLDKKEKEQKKAMKEAKRKAKEMKLVEKIIKKKDEGKSEEVEEEERKQ